MNADQSNNPRHAGGEGSHMTTLCERRSHHFIVKKCECPQCRVMIPEQNLRTNYTAENARIVKAYCDHCDAGFIVHQRYDCGDWQDLNETIVANKLQKSAMLLEMAPARREIQRNGKAEQRRLDRVIGKRLEEDESQPHAEFDSQL